MQDKRAKNAQMKAERATAELHRGGAGQGKVLPSLFDFAPDEIEAAREAGVLEKILVRALTLAV